MFEKPDGRSIIELAAEKARFQLERFRNALRNLRASEKGSVAEDDAPAKTDQETPLASPTPEQNQQAEAALQQSLGIWARALVDVLSQPQFNIEHSQIDTRPESEKKDDDTSFLNITGAWGRAPECVAEVKTLAAAMGDKGLLMDLISMPGHGETDETPNGWGADGDFDDAADVVAAHIEENLKDNPDRPVVINAWSMGGITALKTAARHPELVDGLILIDTPVFPANFKRLALRFLTYEMQKMRSVKTEDPFDIDVDDPGLGIFADRIRDRNKKHGIPLKVLWESAKSLAKQDVVDDGTLDKIAENAKEKGIPVLILRGSNDYVIPHEQTSRLYKELTDRGVGVVIKTLENTGHGMIQEQPIASGEIVREWLEEKGLV